MIVDAHQHFWQLARGDYPWPNETVAPIFRDFGPEHLAPMLKKTGVQKTVLVQATDTVEETEFLFGVAARVDWIAGVVGWVDLSAPQAIATIDRLRQNPYLKGLRPMLQNIEETDWILKDSIAPALTHMAKIGLCFDALIQPRHLTAMSQLAQGHPDLKIVIDHVAKPTMGNAQSPSQAWLDGMKALAERANVHCKLSGMVTEIGPHWGLADILPFADHVLKVFGPNKTIFGSDWPVVNLAGSYDHWLQTVGQLLDQMPDEDKAKVLGLNAVNFYQL